MPEETNRVLTDAVAEVLLTHSPEAKANLIREGRSALDVFEVGNTMIDSLFALRERFDSSGPRAALGVEGDYLLVTLHRPALVDGELLGDAISALNDVAAETPVVFPVHPRTRIRMNEENLTAAPGLHLAEPLGYLEFMGLVEKATGVLTDSGGVQEETTVLGIPCFTLRDNTERPVTVSQGTNTLLGLDPARIREVPQLISEFRLNDVAAPAGWDGKASVRTVDVLEAFPDSRR
jgi:UDP-N-acetylglucosamine 2-epimerase (non-hydrolysing)